MYTIRSHERIALPATATLNIADEQDVHSIQTMVADMSLAGIGVYSDQAITEGKDLSIDIYFISIEGSMKSASVDGTSVYIRKIRDIYYVGIQFKETLDPTKQPLLHEQLTLSLRYSRSQLKSMNEKERTDRRNHQRVSFREDILLDGIHFCASNDISEAGIYVSGTRYFDENDIVEITLPLGEEKITVKGQVRNCQPGIGAGLVFIDLHDDQRARIRELIESIAKSYEKQKGFPCSNPL